MAIEKLNIDWTEFNGALDKVREEIEREPSKCYCADCESEYYAKDLGCPFCGSNLGVMEMHGEE